MQRIIDMDAMETVQLMPETTAEEIIQNLALIVSMPLGSGPMCRDVGTSTESSGMPDLTGRAILTRDVFTAVQDQEPRVTLRTVDFEESGTGGHHTAVMEVEING